MVPDLVFPPRDVEHALVVHAHEELPLQPDAHGHVALGRGRARCSSTP